MSRFWTSVSLGCTLGYGVAHAEPDTIQFVLAANHKGAVCAKPRVKRDRESTPNPHPFEGLDPLTAANEREPVGSKALTEPPFPADEAQEAAERRRRRRLARGTILPPEADFLKNTIEVRAHLAFNGTVPGPFSLFTALAGWNEVGASIEGGLATWRDFTISGGFRAHYAAELIPQALTPRVSDYDDVRFRWNAWETGATARVLFHFTRLASVDPYLFGGFGAGAFHMGVSLREPIVSDKRSFTVPYLRGEIGAGLDIPIKHKLWIGVEARYLITGQLKREDRLHFDLPDETWATFTFHPQHRPPKGFSWVFSIGYRF